jgi:hypothetical protein
MTIPESLRQAVINKDEFAITVIFNRLITYIGEKESMVLLNKIVDEVSLLRDNELTKQGE